MPDISGKTALYCLAGHPARHSLSPAMHTEAFRLAGIDAVYLAFDIAPDGSAFEDAVRGFAAAGIRGMNLTMPYKKRILPLLDEILPAGELAGSVNTVRFDDGHLTGTTTDGAGFLDSLRTAGIDPAGKVMTILGAGGAATAIIAEAALQGMQEIRIFRRGKGPDPAAFQRTVDFAARVSARTAVCVTVTPLEDTDALRESLGTADLLVNATNVGMKEDASLVPPDFLRPGLFVSDIIYEPAETRLLREAREAGLQTMNGKYMLLYQGAAAFKFWTGQAMDTETIRHDLFAG